MKTVLELKTGFGDAENYQRRENRDLFNRIFVKNEYLDNILSPNTFFLIGEKGTGKTAYAVYLANNNYQNTTSSLRYIRETEYQKFVTLKRDKQLQLSDYTSIWKVVILLLLAKALDKNELDHNPFSKSQKIKDILSAIDEYYANAFSPEIINALVFVENSKLAAELVTKHLKAGGEAGSTATFNESRFQINLLYLENKFKEALSNIKIKQNHFLFIDGIDIRPNAIPFPEYLECIKGLADAIWSLNNDFFANIKDSKGRFRAILLVRPDIFNSIGLQNMTNKVKDNSVYFDWRTTYPNYRNSQIFILADRFLASQQDDQTIITIGNCWDHYFPWKSTTASPGRESDPSFIDFLRISYSRPRDIITLISLLQEEVKQNISKNDISTFKITDFNSASFQNRYSDYLMGGIRDQLSFYYDNADYEMFLRFFSFLENRAEFTYIQYEQAYNKFTDFVLNNHTDIPNFIETKEIFLQFLYDTNIICYLEQTDIEVLFRWCYRERSYSNISPKVKPGLTYRIHYGLHKALNVGLRTR